jgi:hypothetical protein
MRQAYFWPIYGDADEMVFHYAPSRAHEHVQAFLGDFNGGECQARCRLNLMQLCPVLFCFYP